MALDLGLEQRIKQLCDGCHATDIWPRHTKADFATGDVQSMHFDCCADTGCEHCQKILIKADHKQNEQLLAYLMKSG